MRAALEALAVAAPVWLAEVVDVAEFAHRYGERINGWTMPTSKTKRDRLAQVFGQDALTLCRAAWADAAPPWIREIETVQLLRQVLVQTYYIHTDNRGGRWSGSGRPTRTAARPTVSAWPRPTTPMRAGPPRARNCSGWATRFI
ncbi:hypothetical protein ACFYQA_38880 [Streptomyces sp. NPDC005774]|uniref:hypothetical protein n=1 Tax=Streptomyces sp. NPDC005774 TaxID=3364728 RepID=UPI0036738ABE